VPDPDVRLVRVSKLYDGVAAVDDLSLDIEVGEFFSILGPSGCGKSTTLRMIAGFDEPTLGTILLGDRDVTDTPPFRRDVNTVFQSYALFPHLDVFENVAFGLRRKRVAKGEIDRRAREALALVDLAGYERRRPPQLSGGQQQRVALARALVNRPRVLLLDEPLGALDLKLRKQMQFELKRIQAEVGITFVYVTHDQDEAMTMSDRLAVMRGGRIEQVGPPRAVYERPATEFVATFLGASNLLDGDVVESGGDHAAIRLAAGGIVHCPRASLDGAGPTVRVGVRPEQVAIVPEDRAEPAAGRNSIGGVVCASTYVGVSFQHQVDTADGVRVTVYQQNADPAGVQPHVGQRVRLEWLPESTFVVAR
jgi:spermidine/putrescine transport system ATP-binding protein